MIEINTSVTQKVADLARLELTSNELETFTHQLSQILKYVDQLGLADTQGIEPLTHAHDLAAPLREDVVEEQPKDSDGNPTILQSAPETLHRGYRVPPIL
jgi:aspartyl-tRNA(Asn)/glutamyl-tRNA(Gln) amidotransferase subunit C